MKVKVVLTAVAILLMASAAHADFFVSSQGRDTWSGTLAAPNSGKTDGPFATLDHARDAARGLKAGKTIWLRGGTYRLDKPLELTRQDSGTTYRACRQEAVRLTGGPIISGSALKPVIDARILERLDPSARTKTLQIDLRKLGIKYFGDEWPRAFSGYAGWPELFFDGKPMQIARWPNEGFIQVPKVLDAGSHPCLGEKPDRGGTFFYEGDRPSRWLKANEVYLNGYWCWKWYIEALKVAKIDTDARTITFAAPHIYGITPVTGGNYYAMNLLEELDSPGEYYLDRKSGILYFWPPEDPFGKEISLSLAGGALVSLDEASGIRLAGLTFELCRGSAMRIQGGHDNLVTGCTFRNLADDAVVIQGGTKNKVLSCDFHDLGAGAVVLRGGNRNTLTPCENAAVNNHIHHFSRLFRTGRPAFWLEGVGCIVRNNLVHDAPSQAIWIRGNDHLVEYNEVHHVCMETDDAGAVYMGRDWASQGTKIRYNYFHDIGGGGGVGTEGVYLDDETCGITCIGNTICRAGRGFMVCGGRDNIIANNVLVDVKNPFYVSSLGVDYPEDSIMRNYEALLANLKSVPYQSRIWRARYKWLALFLEDDPGYPKRNLIQRNLEYRCGEDFFAPKVREYGTIGSNWVTSEDPGIIQGKTGMPELKPDALAFKKIPGFTPIPYSKIGLFTDEYRTALP